MPSFILLNPNQWAVIRNFLNKYLFLRSVYIRKNHYTPTKGRDGRIPKSSVSKGRLKAFYCARCRPKG